MVAFRCGRVYRAPPAFAKGAGTAGQCRPYRLDVILMTLTVAHLTDVHLGPVAGFGPRYWNLKRGLGYLNWMRKRRHEHQRAALDRIVADLSAQQPDHIAVTGDLANIGLPQEHINALAWLKSLGPPELVTVVPGNHDTYVRSGPDPGARRWADYMRSNAAGLAFTGGDAEGPPFVRVLGEIAIVGIDSAVPTPPLLAWGKVGRKQRARLEAILRQLRGAGLFRLVLIHHPPLRGQADATRGLRDAADVEAVLQRGGAELVIHGHNHRNMLAWLPPASAGPGRTAVVGAPSASLARAHGREALARYNLYRIARVPDAAPGSWRAELVGRGLAEPEGPVVELDRRELTLGEPCP
jgi:3',5'-cyclic AMP phosphodiesterase CpdA